jgi:hypothetical protein
MTDGEEREGGYLGLVQESGRRWVPDTGVNVDRFWVPETGVPVQEVEREAPVQEVVRKALLVLIGEEVGGGYTGA